MPNLQVFKFDKKEVRTQLINDEPWFVAKDVCNILGLKNNREALSRLDADEKEVISTDTLGGRQAMSHVNEFGLYQLVLSSRKSEAKEFKRWVTHEVVPSIRKHGAYMTSETIEEALLNPDTLIKLATNLKDEQQKRQAAELRLEEQKPKVVFADAVEVSRNSVSVKTLATVLKQNGVDIGQNRLFIWLRDNKFISSRPGSTWNMPTQKSMDRGLFELKPNVYFKDGEPETKYTPLVTGKGQVYFINKFKSQGVLL